VRFAFSWSVGEAAVNDGFCRLDVIERERPQDDGQQHHQNDLLHGPKRGSVGGVSRVLRGKRPGNPG
jgi:hypothetical protein